MVLGNGKRIFGKGFQLLLACFLVAGFMTISVAVQAADAPPAPAAQSAVPEAAAPARKKARHPSARAPREPRRQRAKPVPRESVGNGGMRLESPSLPTR